MQISIPFYQSFSVTGSTVTKTDEITRTCAHCGKQVTVVTTKKFNVATNQEVSSSTTVTRCDCK